MSKTIFQQRILAAAQHHAGEDAAVVALGVGELFGVEEMTELGVVALGRVLDPEETADADCEIVDDHVEFSAVELEFGGPELLVLVKLAGTHGRHLKS